MPELIELLETASLLADDLRDDIPLARTREEHIRVTARANAARELVDKIFTFTTTASKTAVVI